MMQINLQLRKGVFEVSHKGETEKFLSLDSATARMVEIIDLAMHEGDDVFIGLNKSLGEFLWRRAEAFFTEHFNAQRMM